MVGRFSPGVNLLGRFLPGCKPFYPGENLPTYWREVLAMVGRFLPGCKPFGLGEKLPPYGDKFSPWWKGFGHMVENTFSKMDRNVHKCDRNVNKVLEI